MQNKQTSQIISAIFAACLIVVVASGSFLLGAGLGFGTGRWTATRDVGTGVLPVEPMSPRAVTAPNDKPEEFELFWEAWEILQQEFYGELPDHREMTYGAIQGVLRTLDDPNTSFLTPEQAEFFATDISGTFEGIGARVEEAETGGVRILEPFEGQPAFKAGLRRGDIILKVDSVDLTELDLTEVISLIRGPRGTTITLTVQRPPDTDTFEIDVTRARIDIPTVDYEMITDEIAYLKLSDFNARAPRLVDDALHDLLVQNAETIILDLRGNPGGLLSAAVEIGSQFVGEGNILIERFATGEVQEYRAQSGGRATDRPIVVLVNGGTASASEIVAGAIQDTRRGTLVGETTFGKGSVQLPHTLSDGSILRVTIARWYTPDDRLIHDQGLEPDIFVELTDEDREADRDPQLDRAIEFIQTGR